MGEDGSGTRPAERARALSAANAASKPPAARLYGRSIGHALRPRQTLLMQRLLPLLTWDGDAGTGGFGAFVPARRAVEIGFGSGEHAQALVSADPGLGLIACEVFANGIAALLSRLVPEGAEATASLPPGLRVWPDDGRALLRQLPARSLDAVYLMFPDPWPKARHAKRRFVHPAQVALVARAVRPGGVWRVASDDPTYQAWTRTVLGAQTWFTVEEVADVRPDGWPPTRYEAKARRAGRTPVYWTATRTNTEA